MGINAIFQCWSYQYEYFGNHGDYTCLVLDNRGIGHTDSPPGRYTTKEMAKDVVDLLKEIGWLPVNGPGEKFHLVGSSMGGMISQELSLQIPEALASLTLSSTHSSPGLPSFATIAHVVRFQLASTEARKTDALVDWCYPTPWSSQPVSEHTLTLAKQAEQWASNKQSEEKEGSKSATEGTGILTPTHFHYPVKTNKDAMIFLLQTRLAQSRPPTTTGAVGQSNAVATHRLSHSRLMQLKSFGFPILVCTGDSDNMVPCSRSRYLNEVLEPKRFRVFEGVGHSIHDQYPEEFNAMLKEHVDEAQSLLKKA
ncbi:hypothetical protein HDV05_000711 [Chytridiales sp. JEL 0842]|nr:hypothetical protein HDV05_000711 [Chytridiales sp. JEL 0842]